MRCYNDSQKNRATDRSRRSMHICLFCFLSVFFFGILIFRGTPVYSDSEQYISMHVHREPVYPLFLWLTRLIVGEHSLLLAGLIQSLLAVHASYRFITYVVENICIRRHWVIYVAVTMTVITPYLITPLMSVTHVMLSSGILSESLAMPLFLIYVIYAHKMIADRTNSGNVRISNLLICLFIGFVLSLIRSQMIVTLIAWVILATIAIIVNHGTIYKDVDNDTKTKSSVLQKVMCTLIIVLVFAICIPFRTILTKSYNKTFNDRYVNNVYTNLTMLTNVFYVTDRESGELIDDDDLKGIFYRLYDVMDENEWSYKYAGTTAVERAVYLEEVHDKVKFDVLEAGFRDILNERGMEDYIDYNHKAEEYCEELIKILRPNSLIIWFKDWIIMGVRGVVRSIAVCHPIMYIFSLLLLLYTIIGTVICLKRARKQQQAIDSLSNVSIGLSESSDKNYMSIACFTFVSLLLLFGNAFGTAFTIMCLARYMIYGFAPFYSSVIVLTLCIISNHRHSADRVVTP